MKQRARGGRKLPVGLVGEEPDGGGGCCRCRRSGARASELRLQKGPLGDADHSCVLEEARGGVCWPESSPEHRRTVAVFEQNLAAWGRVEVGRQRGSGEEGQAL